MRLIDVLLFLYGLAVGLFVAMAHSPFAGAASENIMAILLGK